MHKILLATLAHPSMDSYLNRWEWWVTRQNKTKTDNIIITNGDTSGLYQQSLLERLRYPEKFVVIDANINSHIFNQNRIKARNTALEYAKQYGYTHLFFLDMDTIPYLDDTIDVLLAMDKPLTGGLYQYKNRRHLFVASVQKGQDVYQWLTIKNVTDRVEQLKHSGKNWYAPMKVKGLGTGLMLVRKELFDVPFREKKMESRTAMAEQTEDIVWCDDVYDTFGISPYVDVRCLGHHYTEQDIKDGGWHE